MTSENKVHDTARAPYNFSAQKCYTPKNNILARLLTTAAVALADVILVIIEKKSINNRRLYIKLITASEDGRAKHRRAPCEL